MAAAFRHRPGRPGTRSSPSRPARRGDRGRGLAGLAALLYVLALVLPGLHLTLVPHGWDAEGHLHACGLERGDSERVAREADRPLDGGPLLAAADGAAEHGAPCSLDGPQRPTGDGLAPRGPLGLLPREGQAAPRALEGERLCAVPLLLLAPKNSPPLPRAAREGSV